MEEFIEQIGEMILESVPALAVLTFMISVYMRSEELMMRLWSNIKVLILIVHNSYLLPKIKSIKVKLAKNV